MRSSRLNYLIDQFYAKNITPSEHEELLSVLLQDKSLADDFLKSNWDELNGDENFFSQDESELLLNNISQDIQERKSLTTVRSIKINKILVAASLLIISSIAVVAYFIRKDDKAHFEIAQSKIEQTIDVSPGRQSAILTLSNRKKIQLDGIGQGILAIENGTSIEKTKDGKIIYDAVGADQAKNSTATTYNTITIPVGGQFTLKLPDGTMVWLNSSSSLTYPTIFNGKTRSVELTGEAYFEVAKNKQNPFHVKTPKTNIEVLGTHFNISAYEDENINRTTLLEGSVKISSGTKNLVMRPGDQATLINGSNKINIQKVDTEEAVAWKNGYFMFADENIHSIMKKLSRWYGVEVQFDGLDINETFGGTISKYKNISEVLEVLGETQTIHFKIVLGKTGNGRRVIVMK